MRRPESALDHYADTAGPLPPGPPPPPWERQRRTRRRVLLGVLIALVVVAIPVGLLVGAELTRDDADETAAGDDPPSGEPDAPAERDQPADPDQAPDSNDAEPPGSPPEGDLEPPDVAGLDGVDAIFGQLLIDIDVSERAMIAFQDALQAAFEEHGFDDASALIDDIEDAANTGAARLEEVRSRLADPVDHDGAEAVRTEYVDHLDAWVRYMEAVAEDPALLDPEVDSSRYLLAINTSAHAFARALEENLPDDVNAEVAAFAEGILDRGFRADAEAQV